MRETKFKRVLRWSEFGKLLFIGQSLFIIGSAYIYLVQRVLEGGLQYFMELRGMDNYSVFLYPFNSIGDHPSAIAFITASIFLPFFLACLTQWKLVKPLSEEKVPSQKWFHLLRVMGLSSVIFLQVFFIALPWLQRYRHYDFYYIPEILLSNILGMTLFFSSLIVGTLCVAIAKHKSKKLVWSFPNIGVTKFKFEDTLRWSEYGMLSFILSLFSATLVLQRLSNGIIYFNFYFRDLMLWTLFFWTLFLLILLTYEKLVKPLKKW